MVPTIECSAQKHLQKVQLKKREFLKIFISAQIVESKLCKFFIVEYKSRSHWGYYVFFFFGKLVLPLVAMPCMGPNFTVDLGFYPCSAIKFNLLLWVVPRREFLSIAHNLLIVSNGNPCFSFSKKFLWKISIYEIKYMERRPTLI